jgi:hypothetical protein
MLVAILIFILATAACGGKNAECKVSLDRDGTLSIIVNPPGEKGDAPLKGGLTRTMEISASGGSRTTKTILEGQLDKTYSDSGNTYTVDVYVTIENDKMTGYRLEVQGDAYGSETHVCEK